MGGRRRMRGMSADARCVIALASGDPEGVRAAVNAGPEWPRVVELAGRHQVDALSWWNLRHVLGEVGGQIGGPVCGPASGPISGPISGQVSREVSGEVAASVLQPLKEAFQRVHLSNRMLVEELRTVTGALRRAGVEAIILKGPWLAFRAYPDPGTRPVGDIDLCLHEETFAGAARALESIGYRIGSGNPADPSRALSAAHLVRQIRFHAPHRRLLEAHFRLVNVGLPAPEPWLWRNSREWSLEGETIRVPCAGAMLLHLVLHAGQHGFASLRLLHDIRWELSIDGSPECTAFFLERVRALRCQALAYHALSLAAEMAGANVPEALLAELRPGGARRRVFTGIWRLGRVRRLDAARVRQEWELPRLYFLECGTPAEKLRYLRALGGRDGGARQEVVKILRRGARREARRRSEPPAGEVREAGTGADTAPRPAGMGRGASARGAANG